LFQRRLGQKQASIREGFRVQGSKIQGLRVEDSRGVRIEAQWNVVASAE
jgi:hypothetical protein